MWGSSPFTGCGHRGPKRMHPDKCVQKVTLRHHFFHSLTHSLWQQRGQKRLTVTPTASSLYGGCLWNKRVHTHTHTNEKKKIKGDSCHPLACAALMVWGRQRSMGGWALESGTDRTKTSHWSRVTTSCLLFFFYSFRWLNVQLSVFLMHPFLNYFKGMCAHPIIFNASAIDDQKVNFKVINEKLEFTFGYIHANTYMKCSYYSRLNLTPWDLHLN